jgi:dTDP-4-amino-4,6-dideoxygalactose transaminase
LPSDILAAFLFAQLEKREQIQAKRRQIWENYAFHRSEWAQMYDAKLPTIPQYCEQLYHMFYMLLPSFEERQSLIRHLKSLRINAVFHYLPPHLSKMGRKFGGKL